VGLRFPGVLASDHVNFDVKACEVHALLGENGARIGTRPRVLVAAQPTLGVDIGATEYIHHRFLDQRATGTATLLISEDLDEILALADRILVLYEGRVMGIVERNATDAEELGLMMAGVTA